MKRMALALLIFTLSGSPVIGQKQQNPSAQKPNVTKESPKSVESVPVIDNSAASEKQQEAKEQRDRRPPFWDIYWPTLALVIVTGVAVWSAVKTLGAIRQQVDEMRKTGEQTDKLIAESVAQTASLVEQAKALSESAYHLGESAAATYRSASAMENVAERIAVSTQAATASVSAINKQIRAYLFVLVGSGTIQNRASNLKFAASPTLLNAGNTPAHKVSYRIKAAVLPVPLPSDFTFPLPSEVIGGSPVGPHQNATMNAVVDDFCADEEVEGIKIGGHRKALYAWGIVTYKDVFGESHSTKFCHTVHFVRFGTEDKVVGFYIGRHEDID